MRVDARVRPAADPSHVLEPQFNAQAGASNKVGRVPVAAQVIGIAADEKDSSIYDFNTYAEGEEAVGLLIQNGFDGTDLWLVGKGREGAWHPPGNHAAGDQIKSQNRHGPFWGRLSDFVFESSRKTGPHVLMMHGNSAEASKAHGVMVEHTNGLIEECLRFR
jgi:hypothetical protein